MSEFDLDPPEAPPEIYSIVLQIIRSSVTSGETMTYYSHLLAAPSSDMITANWMNNRVFGISVYTNFSLISEVQCFLASQP